MHLHCARSCGLTDWNGRSHCTPCPSLKWKEFGIDTHTPHGLYLRTADCSCLRHTLNRSLSYHRLWPSADFTKVTAIDRFNPLDARGLALFHALPADSAGILRVSPLSQNTSCGHGQWFCGNNGFPSEESSTVKPATKSVRWRFMVYSFQSLAQRSI